MEIKGIRSYAVNSTVTLRCEMNPIPPDVNFDWDKDGHPLDASSPRHQLSGYTLTILNALPEDAGRYVCRASTETFKLTSDSRELNILGKFEFFQIHSWKVRRH